MVEVSPDVSDALGVHDVDVVVLAEELSGRGELGFAGRGHKSGHYLNSILSTFHNQGSV